VSRRFVIRLASAAHRATDRTCEEELAELPARLDQVDAWIAEGRLDGAALNAADFQVATAIAFLLRFEDLAPLAAGRPAERLARRVVPDELTPIRAVLPAAWLAPRP
jgi:glutathione S-transferase